MTPITTKNSDIFADPAWAPLLERDEPLRCAPAELLAKSLETAIIELRAQGDVSRWLLVTLRTAQEQLRAGDHVAALATIMAVADPLNRGSA